MTTRHKERTFGKGCVEQLAIIRAQLTQRLPLHRISQVTVRYLWITTSPASPGII